MTEKEKLIKLIADRPQPYTYESFADYLIANGVRIPVRCGECVHALNDTEYCKKTENIYCEFDNMIVANTHYCSYGERREDNG